MKERINAILERHFPYYSCEFDDAVDEILELFTDNKEAFTDARSLSYKEQFVTRDDESHCNNWANMEK